MERQNPNGTLDSRTIYAYDAKGNLIEITGFKTDGSVNSSATYTRDAKGLVFEMARYTSAGILDNRVSYVHDSWGNETIVVCYNAEGSILFSTASVYEYDSCGNWIVRTQSVLVPHKDKDHFESQSQTIRAITYYP